MRLLLLNTCGVEGSVALADTGLAEPVVAQVTLPGRTASERLVAIVRETLAAAQWRLGDLAAIGVVSGPGSFTGVRVGLSVAKGLGEAAGVPLISVSRLAMLAAAATTPEGRVCALFDAGRGEFYCGEYQGTVALGERLMSREDAVDAALRAEVVVACEEAVLNGLKDVVALRVVAEPAAADALPIVARRMAEGNFDDPMTLDANYMRRTDAEIFAKPAVSRTG